MQQQLGEANTALHAKEEESGKLAEERDRLVTQLAKQAELLKKVQKEAEDKETSLLAEFATERSAWTDKEVMLTAGFGEIDDIVDGELPSFFPSLSCRLLTEPASRLSLWLFAFCFGRLLPWSF